MKNLKETAKDIRDIGKMAFEIADNLEKIASIDLTGLRVLLGDEPLSIRPEVQPAQALPKDTEKRPNTHPTRKMSKYTSRKMSKPEKEQIRLLWDQSGKSREIVIPELAETYKTSLLQICAILFNGKNQNSRLNHPSTTFSTS